jgi:hypothetical protein
MVIFQEPTQRDVCGNAGADDHMACDVVRTQKSQYVKVITVHTMKANRGSGRIGPRTLNLGTRQK